MKFVVKCVSLQYKRTVKKLAYKLHVTHIISE